MAIIDNIAAVGILARQLSLGCLLMNGEMVILRFIGVLDEEARVVHARDWQVTIGVIDVDKRRRRLGRGL